MSQRQAAKTLGRLLQKVMREPHGRPKKTVRAVPFSEELKRLNLAKPRASEAQPNGTPRATAKRHWREIATRSLRRTGREDRTRQPKFPPEN
jgi:hypothetical protein